MIQLAPMRRFLPFFLTLACLASDADFNGRWNIIPAQESKNRVWWLEISGAGSPALRGSFVGAPGGQLDPIPQLAIRDSQLEFSFERAYPLPGTPQQKRKGLYKARVQGDTITGSFTIEGSTTTTSFKGHRAPVIADKDDPSWRKGQPIDLFNTKDFSGWHAVGGGPITGWTVQDGILANAAGVKNLITDRKFWNVELHCEYKVGPHSNSGIGLRDRYEIQILEDHGEPPSLHGAGALYSRIAPRINASKPAGEWQTMDIRLVGRTLTVVHNGQMVIDHGLVEGLTAIATDANEAEPGPIALQGDHGPVAVRKLTVTPLTR